VHHHTQPSFSSQFLHIPHHALPLACWVQFGRGGGTHTTGRKGALGSLVFPVLCHHGQCQWLAYPGNNSSKKGSERVPGPLKFLRAPLPSCPWQVLVGREGLVLRAVSVPAWLWT
jgi:hypothetical protein